MTDVVAETWEDVGVNVLATRQRKNQTQTFQGFRWFDPTSTSREQDP